MHGEQEGLEPGDVGEHVRREHDVRGRGDRGGHDRAGDRVAHVRGTHERPERDRQHDRHGAVLGRDRETAEHRREGERSAPASSSGPQAHGDAGDHDGACRHVEPDVVRLANVNQVDGEHQRRGDPGSRRELPRGQAGDEGETKDGHGDREDPTGQDERERVLQPRREKRDAVHVRAGRVSDRVPHRVEHPQHVEQRGAVMQGARFPRAGHHLDHRIARIELLQLGSEIVGVNRIDPQSHADRDHTRQHRRAPTRSRGHREGYIRGGGGAAIIVPCPTDTGTGQRELTPAHAQRTRP